MACVGCGRDLHEECLNPPVGKKCCCVQVPVVISTEPTSRQGKNYKPDDELSVSGGRKRAGSEYKIYPEKPCDWRWKKNCGGGKYPIIGCLGGMQEHRHHGPVKNTARNEPTNVHLVCTPCHNRWHTLNDLDYQESINEDLPHSPVPATLEECSDNEIKWKSGYYNANRYEPSGNS
jgi:hypothetical protein